MLCERSVVAWWGCLHHAEAIRRLGFAEVAAVCSRNVESARLKAGKVGILKVYERYEELIADVDVVDVVTPTRDHYPVALAAIAAGSR